MTPGRSSRWLVALVLLAACAEDAPLTEIVVVVDSDITALEDIVVTADNFSDARLASGNVGPGAPPLPRSVGLVHDGGPLGPVGIVALGLDDEGHVLVERGAQVSFVLHEVRVLRLELTRACRSVHSECADDETCIDGECADDEGELEPWTGAVPDAWL